MVIIQEGGGEEEEMRGLSGERSNEWMNENCCCVGVGGFEN